MSQPFYTVTVKGIYHARDLDGKTREKPYEVTVPMSVKHKEAGLLSSFVKYYANTAIQAKYPDYSAIAEHYIVDVKEPSGLPTKDPVLMSRAQLLVYIRDNALAVKPELYPDDLQLQQAVLDFTNDPEVFIIAQTKLEEMRGDDIRLQNEALALMASQAAAQTPVPQALVQQQAVANALAAPSVPPSEPEENITVDEISLDENKDLLAGV